MTREPILAALWALLAADARWVTKSRRVQHWADVPPNQQPALFLAVLHEVPEYLKSAAAVKWTVHGELYVYANTADRTVAPSTVLSALLDPIETVLAADVLGQPQTLGGLVDVVRLGPGPIIRDDGSLGDQAVALVPFEIVVGP